MDIQKFLKKLPAFVKKFQDATNFDGKLTFADVQFALDLVALAASQCITQDVESRGYQAVKLSFGGPDEQPVLDPSNHSQMMGYLAKLPELATAHQSQADGVQATTAQPGDQGYVVTEGQEPRQMFQWGPVLVFSVELAKKLVEAWQKKKKK